MAEQVADKPIMTRYAAECTREYLHSTMHCGQVYMAPTGMLLDWLGTIIALHPEPEALMAALQEAGSERIFRPTPCPGVCLDEDYERLAAALA